MTHLTFWLPFLFVFFKNSICVPQPCRGFLEPPLHGGGNVTLETGPQLSIEFVESGLTQSFDPELLYYNIAKMMSALVQLEMPLRFPHIESPVFGSPGIYIKLSGAALPPAGHLLLVKQQALPALACTAAHIDHGGNFRVSRVNIIQSTSMGHVKIAEFEVIGNPHHSSVEKVRREATGDEVDSKDTTSINKHNDTSGTQDNATGLKFHHPGLEVQWSVHMPRFPRPYYMLLVHLCYYRISVSPQPFDSPIQTDQVIRGRFLPVEVVFKNPNPHPHPLPLSLKSMTWVTDMLADVYYNRHESLSIYGRFTYHGTPYIEANVELRRFGTA